ncbi:hypothetical protein D3C77_681970 [compost metagenome]
MTVITHAQHQHIDARQFGQGLISCKRSGFKAGGSAVEAKELRPGGIADQQMTLEQTGITVGMFDRHPALISQGHQYL